MFHLDPLPALTSIMSRPDVAPESTSPPDDSTLAAYLEVHSRPPAYDGADGHPYTVSREVEKTSNLRAPYAGYLVFPRWAESGVGIVGHLETPTLVECASNEQALEELGKLTLLEVQSILVEAIRRHVAEGAR